MMINVCGKYPLELLELPGSSEHSYFHYLKNAERNSLCFEQVIMDLPKGISVVEHFGGVGMTGVIIEKVLTPSWHRIFDIDDHCVTQLQSVFGDIAQKGDAKELMGTIEADLITLDFPNMNAFHYKDWPLDRVFGIKPKFVTIADIACQKIGLHRHLYTKFFGREVFSLESYFLSLSEYFLEKFGYSIDKVCYHSYAAFLLLVPGPSIYTKIGKLS